MKRLRPILKWLSISLITLIVTCVIFGWWFMNLLPENGSSAQYTETTTKDLPYIHASSLKGRGKILAVVTSIDQMGSSGKSTGYELTELSRAYYVFQANGFEVEIASTLGGTPPVVIDDEDMGPYDFAFLNDSIAQKKVEHSKPISECRAEDYEAIYFVGGKGAMFDFPDNKDLQLIVQDLYESNKVVGAVCHGPAALLNIELNSGDHLLKDKLVSGFTNQEELFLIPDAEIIFPFLLQDELERRGGLFNEGSMYLEQVSKSDRLITGQNPWSTWKVAELMIQEMGYQPRTRISTPEENAMNILTIYEKQGAIQAKKELDLMTENNDEVMRELIAIHAIVSAMQVDLGRSKDLVGLTSYAKKISKD